VTADAAQPTAVIPEQQTHLHTPLLVFHDQTPVLTVRSLTGLIELDKAEESYLGVDTSFWIAVALTYLEFLEEREVRYQNVLTYRSRIDVFASYRVSLLL
jgi:hypothetical protein